MLITLSLNLPTAQAQTTDNQPDSKGQVRLVIGSREAVIDGKQVQLAVAPMVSKGTTLVPLRFISEAFGQDVSWDGSTKTITIKGQQMIILQLNSTSVKVNQETKTISMAPVLKGGVTLVPLRFVAEVLTYQVFFDNATKVIAISKEPLPKAVIEVNKKQITLGEKLEYRSASYSPQGLSIVEERWSNPPPWPVPGKYTLSLEVKDSNGFWSLPASVTVNVLAPANRAPVASFQVTKNVVAQGEKLEYINDSHDPDGDNIVDEVWQGNKEVFFTPGQHTVSLRVKDEHGAWSNLYSINITVTDKQLMDELTYNLRYVLPGACFTVNGLDLRSYPSATVNQTSEECTLLLSNNPEKVPGPGVLYRDVVEGKARVFYWHENGSGQPLRFCLLAENKSYESVRLQVLREGTAGPEQDIFGVGRKAMIRYLGAAGSTAWTLAPGEMVIVNAQQYQPAKPGETIHGIYDLFMDGNLTLAVVALPVDANIAQTYPNLQPLPMINLQDRGTFPNADCIFDTSFVADKPSTFVLPDATSMSPLTGYDALTGQPAVNRGNYGVLYHINTQPEEERVVLINPRGGGMCGAVKVNDFVVPIPRQGFTLVKTDVVKGGIIAANRKSEILFMPPGGTSLPLNLVFWPLP